MLITSMSRRDGHSFSILTVVIEGILVDRFVSIGY